MPGGKPSDQWLKLTCASCQRRCRARASATALRCPHCGAAIETPAPEPRLVPALRTGKRARACDDDEQDGSPYAACPKEKTRRGDVPEPDPIENVEKRRKQPAVLPAPLWIGVYGFPWHASGLRPWFLFGIGLTLVALLAGVVHYVIDVYFGVQLLILFVKGMMAFLIWTGMYAAGFFLATIQETGAGNQDVVWPDESIGESLMTFLYVAWIFIIAALPIGILITPLGPTFGFWVIPASLVPSTILIFPIVLLCSLANNSMWMFWNTEVVVSLLKRPLALLTLIGMSTWLLLPCIALGVLTIGWYERCLFLAPVAGFTWSACWLIYGRLLGRVAWVCTGGHDQALRAVRRRRKRQRVS